MIFWTIVSREFGRFCGYKRQWKDLWLKRPVFRWDTFPHQGEVMVFHYERAAQEYIHAHRLPADCQVKMSDTGSEAPPVVSPKTTWEEMIDDAGKDSADRTAHKP